MNEHLRDRILRKLETLSDERLYQILDFVEFLESRYAERQAPPPSAFTRFAESIEDRMRAGRVSAQTIAETMGLMSRAMGILDGVAAAGRSVASDLAGVASRASAGSPTPGSPPTAAVTPATPGASGCAATTRTPGSLAAPAAPAAPATPATARTPGSLAAAGPATAATAAAAPIDSSISLTGDTGPATPAARAAPINSSTSLGTAETAQATPAARSAPEASAPPPDSWRVGDTSGEQSR